MQYRVYTFDKRGSDKLTRSVRILLSETELRLLQDCGALPGHVDDVIDMQECADRVAATFEQASYLASGGRLL